MPLAITTHAGANAYANPFKSIAGTAQLKIDVSTLTTDEVDAYGYLKPGVPFYTDGDLVATGEYVYGCSINPIKLTADDNTTLGTDPDIIITVGFGILNRDIVIDNLGRALTADELAAFVAAGSNCHLTTT